MDAANLAHKCGLRANDSRPATATAGKPRPETGGKQLFLLPAPTKYRVTKNGCTYNCLTFAEACDLAGWR